MIKESIFVRFKKNSSDSYSTVNDPVQYYGFKVRK